MNVLPIHRMILGEMSPQEERDAMTDLATAATVASAAGFAYLGKKIIWAVGKAIADKRAARAALKAASTAAEEQIAEAALAAAEDELEELVAEGGDQVAALICEMGGDSLL